MSTATQNSTGTGVAMAQAQLVPVQPALPMAQAQLVPVQPAMAQATIAMGPTPAPDPDPAPAPVLKTSWYQWSSDVKNTAQLIIIAITIYMSAIFGGIIASQWAITEGMPRRILSFLYGFAWYPLSLAYAIYNPPPWHATVIPLKEGKGGMYAHAPLGAHSTKGSTALRIISLILFAFNMYVMAILIQIRFFI